jgi:hypothetical protein
MLVSLLKVNLRISVRRFHAMPARAVKEMISKGFMSRRQKLPGTTLFPLETTPPDETSENVSKQQMADRPVASAARHGCQDCWVDSKVITLGVHALGDRFHEFLSRVSLGDGLAGAIGDYGGLRRILVIGCGNSSAGKRDDAMGITG